MNNYVIIQSTDKDNLDFNQVQENCYEITRKNSDNTKFIVEYTGELPSSISSLNSYDGPYNEESIFTVVTGSEWIYEIDTNEDTINPECS